MQFSISGEDWSLHRKGYLDRARHQEKVKEAIKKNLVDVVSDEGILISDGQKTIKVPIRSLEQYKFRFNHEKQTHAGQGNGGTKVGDVVDFAKGSGKGKGGEAGTEPGVEYYEAEITVDELADLVFEELGLPNLKPKKRDLLATDSHRFSDVRKQGISSNIDKRRTLLEALKRNAREGNPNIKRLTREDLRFKTWEIEPREESNAVIFAMMDTSGSMGTYEKFLVRSFFFWALRFLRRRYDQVELVFLTHDVEAREVKEQEFFTKGESGGTKCSSVYALAMNIIRQRYDPEHHNLYLFHFSDGENLFTDNETCVQLVKELIPLCSLIGYGEISTSSYFYKRTLLGSFAGIKDPRFVSVGISQKGDLAEALRAFFGKDVENAG